MIHLENAQARTVRVAIRERVETCTEDHVLPDPLAVGSRKLVLGVAAARDEESTHRARAGRLVAREVRGEPLHPLCAKDSERERVLEYERSFEQLMCCPLKCRTLRSSTGFACLERKCIEGNRRSDTGRHRA